MGADMQMLEKDGGENIHMYEKKFSWHLSAKCQA